MGNSYSKNEIDNFAKSIVNSMTNIASNSEAKISQGESIVITGTSGNVDISDITFNQKSYVDLNSVSQMSNSKDVQNQVAVACSQLAESLTKGINLANFSEAVNTMRTNVETAINVTTNFQNNCLVDVKQAASINIKGTGGNVTINTIKFDQVAENFQKCMTTIVNEEKIKQKADTTTTQTAKATTVGIDLAAFLMAVIIFLVVISITLKSFAPYILLAVGVIMLLGGIAAIVVYKKQPEYTTKLYCFTKGINAVRTCKLKLSKAVENMSMDDASDYLMKNEKCFAFDWTKKLTVFYDGEQVSDDCIKELEKPTGVDLVNKINPNFSTGNSNPTASEGVLGDVFINRKTGKVLRRSIRGGWTEVLNLSMVNFDVVCCNNLNNEGMCVCSASDESAGKCGEGILQNEMKVTQDGYIKIVCPYTFEKYVKRNGKYELERKIDGPGKVLTAKSEEEIKDTALNTMVKFHNSDKKLLYGGIVSVVLGPVLMMIGAKILINSNSVDKKVEKPKQFI